ncbi:hypothetical protein [Veillonella caviae]|uniref:hypothetical protein n=1 Tax=Veillonella caviae TaxID=248316 RepID=UPI0023F12FB2|nr:hypothetical protein [Veillonella caviae]MCI6407988.1 hypothetical protein [Veillonella caviae]MDY4746771.1 hypothetical protein [Veillonella caviae]MDY6224802.1 hypothetical protein [Veillonella caviae]
MKILFKWMVNIIVALGILYPLFQIIYKLAEGESVLEILSMLPYIYVGTGIFYIGHRLITKLFL